MDQYIFIEMFERMSALAIFAFILSHTKIFRRLVSRQIQTHDWWLLTVFFGFIGMIGTYSGIPLNDALANSRVVGVMAAGLIGGPVMGVSAGLIAGGHRFFLGGFTALACALANICEGLLAGLIHRFYPARPIPWWVALLGGIAGEIMQMGIILLAASPYGQALRLVEDIALPMIVINPVGLAVFMLIIKSAEDAQERVGSEKAHKVLAIVTKTLPYLRRGLDHDSARETAKIIYDVADYDAVAVTNTEKVLAFVGAEDVHHVLDKAVLTKVTHQVLETGKTYIAQNHEEIGCYCSGCRLASAVVVPLTQAGRVIGTLKLYYTRENMIGHADIVFAEGVAHLFSTQLELTEIDRQAKLASRAELKALYAQINPHFIFNTLNTITFLVRTDPTVARELLIKLGVLFRTAMHQAGKNITLAEEFDHVRAYLTIEKARYDDKLVIHEEISQSVLKYMIPSLTIQPLVENAIRHGLQPKEAGGHIIIKAVELKDCVEIRVIDDGVGMDLASHHPLNEPAGDCIGLVNVQERLCGQYGQGMEISSSPGQGTTIVIRLPKQEQEAGDECA
jgi:two-component system sensor histidine kinase LytS